MQNVVKHCLISLSDLPDPAQFSSFHPFMRGVFSQWHPTQFEIGGVTFANAEQWMMLSKARLFGDEKAAQGILATRDAGQQKRIGQSIARFEQGVWDHRKIGIVYEGNLAKFRNNSGAARQLLATGDAMLVEANPRDWIWGAGLSIDDPAVHSPAEWKGSNLLGRILTKVKNEIAEAGND